MAAFAVGMWSPLPCAVVVGDGPVVCTPPAECASPAEGAGCFAGFECGDRAPTTTPAAGSEGCGPGAADPGCSFCVCCPCWVTTLPAPVTIDLADGEELHFGGADAHYASRTPRPAAPPPKTS